MHECQATTGRRLTYGWSGRQGRQKAHLIRLKLIEGIPTASEENIRIFQIARRMLRAKERNDCFDSAVKSWLLNSGKAVVEANEAAESAAKEEAEAKAVAEAKEAAERAAKEAAERAAQASISNSDDEDEIPDTDEEDDTGKMVAEMISLQRKASCNASDRSWPAGEPSLEGVEGSNTTVSEQVGSEGREMDTDGNGLVDKGKFVAAGGGKDEFNRYDANGDGVLDADEVEVRRVAKDKAPSEGREMDTNGDGLVHKNEFVAAGGNKFDKEEFSKYDANGDGVLDADEMEARAADVNKFLMRARAMFDKLDTNGNKLLEKDEIQELVQWVWNSFHPGGEALTDEQKTEESSRLLVRLNANGDAYLSFEDFSHWFRGTCESIDRYRHVREQAEKKRRALSKKKRKGGGNWQVAAEAARGNLFNMLLAAAERVQGGMRGAEARKKTREKQEAAERLKAASEREAASIALDMQLAAVEQLQGALRGIAARREAASLSKTARDQGIAILRHLQLGECSNCWKFVALFWLTFELFD